jgi:two-component system chemotaxis sensor kinase CheA
MMHLVRNAADHGIESAADRRQAGKPDAGVITVEASRAGDRLVITVSDDGRGIDARVVRAKARERKLMPDDELAALADEQVIQLVFAAGFSTTATVSDISGRGVGMDVVRAAIEQMSGRVALTSQVGAGTTVKIDLPLNIAVSRVMVVDVGGHAFGIPMEAVTETVRLSPDRISEIKGNKGFVLRDRVIPICNLAELMNIPAPTSSSSDSRLIIVAEAAGRVAGLEVEAVRDRLDAILKPMEGLLANSRGYAGTTLLGDGSVLLVLDLKEIIP